MKRFLKVKYIVLLLLIIGVGIALGIYLWGGLKPYTLNIERLEFNTENFVNMSSGQKDEDGNAIPVTYRNNVVIGENDNYMMLFSEQTTIAKLVKKEATCKASDNYANCNVLYQTAVNDDKTSNGASLLLYYAIASNGMSMANPLNSMTNSVNYVNPLTGESEKHFSLKYDEGSKSVQILYEIGNFSAGVDYIPKKFYLADYTTLTDDNGDPILDEYGNYTTIDNTHSFQERFRGNTVFDIVLDKSTGTVSYSGNGRTWSEAAMKYLAETGYTDEGEYNEGTKYYQFTVIDEAIYDSFGEHINCAKSPVTNNPFLLSYDFQSLHGGYNFRDGSLFTYDEQAEYYVHKGNLPYSVYANAYNLTYTTYTNNNGSQNGYNGDIYGGSNIPSWLLDDEGRIVRGGFAKYNAQGEFVYEDGNPVRQLYTLDIVKEDNQVFGIETETSLPRFQVCLELKLTDEGIDATILGNSLKDCQNASKSSPYNHGYYLTNIAVFPRMTANSDPTSQGFMVIPDGSGALINFNNGAADMNYTPYNNNIYGRDMAFNQRLKPEDKQTLMFGMYGYIDTTNKNGMLSIVESGAAQTSIYADTPRLSSKYNQIYFNTSVRQLEEVNAGAGWYVSTFPKWSKEICRNDLKYVYQVIDNEEELNYSSLAKKYKKYLINLYDLEEKDSGTLRTDKNVVYTDFLGAFETYELFLGIKYMKAASLTTFNQAKKIINELLDQGVIYLEVSYEAWTDKEMEYETTDDLDVSRALGGQSGMKSLNKFLKEKNINFYPQIQVSTSKGFEYAYGSFKYSARGVGNDIAKQYDYNLATTLEDRTTNPKYFISPSFFQEISKKLLKSYKKLGINHVYLSDLGNITIGNYNEGKEIYGYEGSVYQQEAMKLFDKNNSILANAPFDYAFPYVSSAINVPNTSSKFGIFDATIPFYQLVASGLFDYSSIAVNGNTNKSVAWHLVKALESGSNIQFLLSYENPNVLLNTDYTYYFQAYYTNWKDDIIYMNTKLNDANIHGGELMSHTMLDRDVFEVKYSNGVDIIVNASNVSYNSTTYGQNIDKYSYYIVSRGGE